MYIYSTHIQGAHLTNDTITPTKTASSNDTESKSIVLGTTNEPDTELYQKAKRVLTAALDKLGYNLTIETLPNMRSLTWANNGQIDGDLFRVSQLNLENLPNLYRVNEPLLTIEQMVLSKKEIQVEGWESLLNYIIVYERGTQFLDAKQQYFKQRFLVNNTKQAFDMIMLDRADFTVTSLSTAKKYINSDPKYIGHISIQKPPLVFITLHVYLNKKNHKELAHQLSLTLKEMKKTGEFEKLLNGLI